MNFDIRLHGTPIFFFCMSLLAWGIQTYLNARTEKAIVNSLITCIETGKVEKIVDTLGFYEYIVKKNNFIVRIEEYKSKEYSYIKVFSENELVYEKNSTDFLLECYRRLSQKIDNKLTQTA